MKKVFVVWLATLFGLANASLTSAQDLFAIDFVKDVQPILEKRCMRCHAGPDARDGIDLSYKEMVVDSYVFGGDPDGSDFYTRMVTDDPYLMMPPPDDGGPMPREEALIIRLWIAEGADWPEGVELAKPTISEPTDEPAGEAAEKLASFFVDFERDVKPILEEHCISCHGAESPTEGISFATRGDVLGNYVFPHEAEASSLYTRLVTEDQGKIMPPPAEGDPLNAAEVFVVKLWIQEGAQWPSEVTLGEPVEAAPDDRSTVARLWAFQGFFHPAVVHFPVALLSIAAVFVVLYWVFGGGFRDAAIYCLIFGALSSIVASMMGWALAPAAGFDDAPFNMSNSAFWHRWSGIVVTGLGLVVAVLAIRARKADREKLSRRTKKELPWQFGTLLLAALVGLTGHQGGELSYGEDWYARAFAQLGIESEANEEANEEATTSDVSEPGDDAAEQEESATDESAETTPAEDESKATEAGGADKQDSAEDSSARDEGDAI